MSSASGRGGEPHHSFAPGPLHDVVEPKVARVFVGSTGFYAEPHSSSSPSVPFLPAMHSYAHPAADGPLATVAPGPDMSHWRAAAHAASLAPSLAVARPLPPHRRAQRQRGSLT